MFTRPRFPCYRLGYSVIFGYVAGVLSGFLMFRSEPDTDRGHVFETPATRPLCYGVGTAEFSTNSATILLISRPAASAGPKEEAFLVKYFGSLNA